MRFQDSIHVAAPAERVFAVYADVTRWPEWTASITSVELLDAGPLAIGARARMPSPHNPTAARSSPPRSTSMARSADWSAG
jgi:uncharacterized membrane protein